MAAGPRTPGVASGRLTPEALAENFADIAPPFSPHEAFVAADRCYFCHDAPCVTACPTAIDIPLFIREIATGVPEAAARTILGQNILGGMCARVCPTETLCEEACVRELAEGKPVEIGRLQRYATDALMARGGHPFVRAEPTGRRVAVVGAGPAGLACAHRLAMLGHDVVLLDARPKGGGLNEFGIAAYKAVDGFAQAEVYWLLGIGGIELRCGQRLGADLTLDELLEDHDAVFLALGLSGVRALHAEGAELDGVRPAVEFIADLRQASDLAALPVGRRVVVVGGGMTAIDAGVQARKLGAEEVTIVYRRGRDRMGASGYEQELAQTEGVRIMCEALPVRVTGAGAVAAVEIARTEDGPDGPTAGGTSEPLAADQVLVAIGQTLGGVPDGLVLDGGKIRVDGAGRTSLPRVWAGGDCATGGDDLTVTAVAEGRDAALDIHAAVMGGDVEATVAAHYAGRELFDRIVARIGKPETEIGAADIAEHDEFHIGNAEATERLLDPLGLPAGSGVLDIGSGIGGPARRMAARYGWAVTGLDLTPDLVETARRLSRLAGDERTRFVVGSALDMPFDSGSFELATLLHVGMNIPDKARLFAEATRVLRPGGRFAVYDIMSLGAGGPTFPVPWAERPEGSFLAAPEAYRAAAADAGLVLEREADRTDVARAFFAAVQEAIASGRALGGPSVVMGANAPEKVANMVAAIRAGAIAPIEMIFRKP